MRKAIVEGQFYPSGKKELAKKVISLIGKSKRENVRAGIVPHAGYDFSGRTAGEIFSLIPEKKDFIILGVNHSGIGKKIVFSLEDFEIATGKIKNNRALGESILHKLKHSGMDVEINETAHAREHSIEVQLPFLQEMQKGKKFEIVPILLQSLSYEECRKVASILSEFVKDKEFVLVSGDFTHYGKMYGFVPFDDAEKNFEKFDRNIIFEIIEHNSKAFYDKARKSTVCGIYGVTILIELANIKDWKSRLVDYTNSASVSGNWDVVVGYAGVVFE